MLRFRHARVLTRTRTQSPQPFQDVDGCVCAFAGRVEYDIVSEPPVDRSAPETRGFSFSSFSSFSDGMALVPDAAHDTGTHCAQAAASRVVASALTAQSRGTGLGRGGCVEGWSVDAAVTARSHRQEQEVLACRDCRDCRWDEDGIRFYNCGQH